MNQLIYKESMLYQNKGRKEESVLTYPKLLAAFETAVTTLAPTVIIQYK